MTPTLNRPRDAPLQVHAQSHDRAHQPHVQDQQRRVPALQKPGAEDQAGHKRKKRIGPAALSVAGLASLCLAHTALPLISPVGLNSSTITRITKLTANL
jgi:hypothetical protein